MPIFARLRANPYAVSAFKALTWFPVVVFFVDHGFSYATVDGRSMQPTFNPDSNMLRRDVVLLNKWSAMNHEFKRGEVVTLTSPTNPNRIITKRIIALEGDIVKPLRKKDTVSVPKGHCWVEGDEAFHSKDSNSFGTVPMGLINAKVTHILWPLSRSGRVELKPLSERVKVGFIQPNQLEEDHWYW
ncbi:mitochondrial inner membrane protease subunit 2 [Syncephalastrum racemosum]|uniref:Mitochondrial inner membrane protease subunit 2 n=1 Tax=Syncephalastrum racemosum TaxID=13706 RepID=A0A1X2HHL6_SYNRA|nr:mitochondrial inner membrane protease subunit 2 [Syncephalastrum racemosum]